jgi:hypothetical protein
MSSDDERSDDDVQPTKPRTKAEFHLARKQKIAQYYYFLKKKGNALISLHETQSVTDASQPSIPQIEGSSGEPNSAKFTNAKLRDIRNMILRCESFDKKSFSKFASNEFVVKLSEEVFADSEFYRHVCDDADLNKFFPCLSKVEERENGKSTSDWHLREAIDKYKSELSKPNLKLSKFVEETLDAHERSAIRETKMRPLNTFLNDLFQHLSGKCWGDAWRLEEEQEERKDSGHVNILSPRSFWEALLPQFLRDIRQYKEVVSFPLKSTVLKKRTNNNIM